MKFLQKLFVPAVLLVAGIAGLMWFGGHLTGHAAGPRKPQVVETQREPVSVTLAPVQKRKIERTVDAVGTLHGFEEVVVAAKVEGYVLKVERDMADSVKPGEVLLQIDPTDSELAVHEAEKNLLVDLSKLGLSELPEKGFDVRQVPVVVQAKAKLENAEARWERAKRLQKTITPEELADKATEQRTAQAEFDNQVLIARTSLATIELKQAELSTAKQKLQDTKIKVPAPTQALPNGQPPAYVISQREVAEGDMVRPGTQVFRLVMDHILKLRAPLPERYISDVKLGQLVHVTTTARKTFEGKVTRISPHVDATVRTFDVEIQVPNPTGELKSGSFAKVAIVTRTESDATTVPLESVVSFAGNNKIFLAEDGKAREILVTLGLQGTEWIEIATPVLPAGANVVTSGQSVLTNGAPVVTRAANNKATKPLPEKAHQQ